MTWGISTIATCDQSERAVEPLRPEIVLDGETARFRVFLKVLTGVVVAVVVVESVCFWIFRQVNIAVGAAILGLYLCVLLVWARPELERGRVAKTALVVGYGLLVCAVSYLPLMPRLYPVLAMVPLVALTIALPFATTRTLRPMLTTAWAAAVALAVTGEFLPSSASDSEVFLRVLMLVGVASIVLLFVLLLGQLGVRLMESIAALSRSNESLRRTNRELEAFTYSVSHDLKAPLRAIDGFSTALAECNGDKLDEKSKKHLGYVRDSARSMGQLIDGLLRLSSVTQTDLRLSDIDLSALGEEIIDDLVRAEPERNVVVHIEPHLRAFADRTLVRVLLHNLLENAFKFTRKTPDARIDVGSEDQDGACVFVVRDNGAGFDMKHSDKLFQPFQRLHAASEFPGTGIGLATVSRVVLRHGGRVWAEGRPGRGTVVRFTLEEAPIVARSHGE